jgi:hypothetical protein
VLARASASLLVVVVASALGGCAAWGGPGAQNPNLLAPKLVVQPRADGNFTLFVHGAFREQVYDWIAIGLDNVSLANESQAFSVETRAPGPGFFLNVDAQVGAVLYETKARLDLNATDKKLHIAFVDADGWSDPRPYSVPFEHILDRPQVGP